MKQPRRREDTGAGHRRTRRSERDFCRVAAVFTAQLQPVKK